VRADRQHWVDRVLGPPLCWVASRLARRGRPEPAAGDVRRILIIVLSEMGALVLTRPMFDRLKQNYPSAAVYVLCSDQNIGALDLMDVVDAEHVIKVRIGSFGALVIDGVRAVRRMRALSVDAVLDLELFARVSAVLAALSGAPIRVGFHRFTQEGLYRGDAINRPVLYNPHQHIAQQFLTLADAIGSTDIPAAKRLLEAAPPALPPLRLRPDELESARDALYRRHPSIASRPLVFVCPGAGLIPIRAWPIASFAKVAHALVDQGYAVAIVGVAADRTLAQTIQQACPGGQCVDLTGYTQTVREIIVLLHLGVLLITNDGGTGHMAALTPIETIVLFGPETPVLYGSLSPRAINLHKPLSCSPCLTAYNHRQSPCDGNNVCLQTISPEEVLTAAGALLGARTAGGHVVC
jgi:lipopolysaccharide heptosyltransferase II